MERHDVGEAGGNLDRRIARIEQVLPTLATKEDLKPLATKEDLKLLATKEDLKLLATKEGLREAVAKLATKEELREAVAKLATKEELREAVAELATKEELREEGERSRRYMKILIEDVKSTIALYAEGVTAVDERDARQHAESVEADKALDHRVTALEAASRKRRR